MATRQDRIKQLRHNLKYSTSSIIVKNPIFSDQHIVQLFSMFDLYVDQRIGKADVRDILVTARSYGSHLKFQLVFRAMEKVSEINQGNKISFQKFLNDLTIVIVIQKIYRVILLQQGEDRLLLNYQILKERGVLEMEDMRFISNDLEYNMKDEELQEVIEKVGGYGKKNISKDRFNKLIERRAERVERNNLIRSSII